MAMLNNQMVLLNCYFGGIPHVQTHPNHYIKLLLYPIMVVFINAPISAYRMGFIPRSTCSFFHRIGWREQLQETQIFIWLYLMVKTGKTMVSSSFSPKAIHWCSFCSDIWQDMDLQCIACREGVLCPLGSTTLDLLGPGGSISPLLWLHILHHSTPYPAAFPEKAWMTTHLFFWCKMIAANTHLERNRWYNDIKQLCPFPGIAFQRGDPLIHRPCHQLEVSRTEKLVISQGCLLVMLVTSHSHIVPFNFQPIRVGGWENFLFFHILGTIFPTDFHIFQRGWNHQPE